MTFELTRSPGEQILVIDDAPPNIDLLARVLEPAGYRVLAASSGEAGIRVAQRAMPDLILLDLMMPGMDGRETCRLLKSSPGHARNSRPVHQRQRSDLKHCRRISSRVGWITS